MRTVGTVQVDWSPIVSVEARRNTIVRGICLWNRLPRVHIPSVHERDATSARTSLVPDTRAPCFAWAEARMRSNRFNRGEMRELPPPCTRRRGRAKPRRS